jgi:hypothetical protein
MHKALASLALLVCAASPSAQAAPRRSHSEVITGADDAFLCKMVDMEAAWKAHDPDAYAAQFTSNADHIAHRAASHRSS